MTTTITPTLQKKHADIESHVADFLANGGTITQCPYGPDSHTDHNEMTEKTRKQREKARKKGSQASSWKKKSVAMFNNRPVSAKQKQAKEMAV